MLKNATPYLVTPGFILDVNLLGRHPARPCGPYDRMTDGFVVPCDHSTHGLAHVVGGHTLLCWQTEERILPKSVVDDAAQVALDAIEDRQGYRPGRKQVREVREAVESELLPKAFVQKKRTYAALVDGYLIIDASSGTRADGFIEALKLALGELPLTFIATNQAASAGMTHWVEYGEAPQDFTIDDGCVLSANAEEASSIRYKAVDLGADHVRERIAAGFTVTKLDMTYNDRLSFQLSDGMTLTKLKLLDLVMEQAEAESDDALSLFDSQWLISLTEASEALTALIVALGGLVAREADLLKEAA